MAVVNDDMNNILNYLTQNDQDASANFLRNKMDNFRQYESLVS